jgi:hypothetical protein
MFYNQYKARSPGELANPGLEKKPAQPGFKIKTPDEKTHPGYYDGGN